MSNKYRIVPANFSRQDPNDILCGTKGLLLETREREELVWVQLSTGESGRWWWRQSDRSSVPPVWRHIQEITGEDPNTFENRMDESDNSIEAVAVLHKLCDLLNERHHHAMMVEVRHEYE